MSLPLPFFSIVIPTHARPKPLTACLEALTRLDYPRDRFEVVVVDDGSPTPLDVVVAPFRERLDLRLQVKRQGGPASARNEGAAQARGQFLAFTDDDCAPRPNWLHAYATTVARDPQALVGGEVVNALHDNVYAAASQLLVTYLYDYYNQRGHGAQFFTSNNYAVSAELFRAIGGFDTSYPRAAAEDRDFCDRWLQAGYRMLYTPDAIVDHAHALTLRKFWRQHMNYGRGAYRFHRRRAQRNQDRIKVEPLTFYFNLLRYPFTYTRAERALPLAALMGVSQGANVLGYVWERLRLASR